MAEKVAAKTKPVADADIENYYKANSARLGGKTLEDMKEQIRQFLVSQNEKSAKDEILAEIKAKSAVRVVLEVPRVNISVAANDPTKAPPPPK